MLGDLDIFDGAAERIVSIFGEADAELPVAE
jgi:hypothetical protein